MLNGSVTNQSYQGTATCTIRCQAQKKEITVADSTGVTFWEDAIKAREISLYEDA